MDNNISPKIYSERIERIQREDDKKLYPKNTPVKFNEQSLFNEIKSDIKEGDENLGKKSTIPIVKYGRALVKLENLVNDSSISDENKKSYTLYSAQCSEKIGDEYRSRKNSEEKSKENYRSAIEWYKQVGDKAGIQRVEEKISALDSNTLH